MALTRWLPPVSSASGLAAAPTARTTEPALRIAIGRGLRGRCPACGEGKLFSGWLRVVTRCSRCAAPLGLARSDDLPPYITILIVGHIIVPLMLWLERAQAPDLWVMTAIFVPMALILTLALMRPVKGATVGLMLKLGLMKEPDEA